MRCCLINPPWFTRAGNMWNQIKSAMPPLGLLYLAAVLEKSGIHVDVLDIQATTTDWERLDRKLKAADYDVFGLTATTPVINNAYRIADIIHHHHPEARIVFGGVHVTALPEEALRHRSIDYVVRGEGEEAFLELLQGRPPREISGLSFTESGRMVHNPPDGLIHDIDRLPSPAYHKVDLMGYKPAAGAYKRLPAINMTSTRGCPARCTFCNSANVKIRKRSAENIFAEMAMLVRQYGIREIQFYDDTFTVYPSNIKRLCQLIRENRLDVTWSCFARADYVTLDLLQEMRAAGCHQIMYGVESANADILANIKKNCALEKCFTAIEMTRTAGIDSRCAFMLGNPGETPETLEETIQLSLDLNPDMVVYNITTPFPGTEMFDWAKKNGYLVTEEWDDYDLSSPVLTLPTIDYATIHEKYRTAYLRFYLRPGIIFKKLTRIRGWADLQVLLRGARSVLGFAKGTLFTSRST